jgi:ABC-2 type transport system permease protein
MTTLISLESPPHRYGAGQTIRAEVTKLRTLRSTKVTILATIVGSLLVTFLAVHTQHVPRSMAKGWDPTNQSLTGLALGSLAIGVLGVLAVTGEYGSGTIRSSLAATPRRPLFLGSKVAVVGAISLVVGEIMSFGCFFLGQAIMSGNAPTATLGQHGVLEALLLSGGFLALLGLLGAGLGLIIRNTAGAMAAYVGLTFITTIVLQSLQNHGNPARFAPEEILANSVAAVHHQSNQLTPGTGFLWMVFYAAAALTIGALVLVRRDA